MVDLAAVLGLPPSKWGQLLGAAETFRQGRLLEAWFRDPADQALVAGSGFDGAVRADAGDYLYPVDSNVAPTSKLSAVTTRSLDLAVQIDAVGNARNTLAVSWQNGIETAAGAPYRALPVIGGLRITPLLAIKTTVLLMFTLWAANAASDFLDKRVQSFTDLTPSIQVLITKLIRIVLINWQWFTGGPAGIGEIEKITCEYSNGGITCVVPSTWRKLTRSWCVAPCK